MLTSSCSHHTLAEIFAEHGDFTRAIASISNAVELATICYDSEGDYTVSLIDVKKDIEDKWKTSAK
jgi:hypothetical protein